MSTKTFREFLQEKAQDQERQARLQRRQEWLASLRRLLEQLRAWLVEADVERVLDITPEEHEKSEQGIGHYSAPGLRVALGDEEVVQIIPVARNVIGYLRPDGRELKSEGRVDLFKGFAGYKLYRALLPEGERWFLVNDRYEAQPLTQSSFEAAMKDLFS